MSELLAECPKPDLFNPCLCIRNGIYCGGNNEIDLIKVFTNLNKTLTKNQKFFSRFHLNNTFITELRANTTLDLTFDDITIEQAKNLTHIDADAFGATTKVTTSLRIFYNPKLENHTSLFGAVKKFTNIVVLSLDFNNITEIPSNALSQHNLLEDVTLRGPSIRKIGDKPFQYLRILNTLEMTQTNIDYIPENAFYFINKNNGNLVFIFNDNNRIDSRSFAENSLINFKRNVNFYYLSKTKEKDLQYLDERVFLPFLLSNSGSLLNVLGHRFDCNDCRSFWLVKNPTLKHRVNYFVCSDNKTFSDKSHFNNCQ